MRKSVEWFCLGPLLGEILFVAHDPLHLFDVEVVFMYPWAVVFKQLGMFGFVEMLVFVADSRCRVDLYHQERSA